MGDSCGSGERCAALLLTAVVGEVVGGRTAMATDNLPSVPRRTGKLSGPENSGREVEPASDGGCECSTSVDSVPSLQCDTVRSDELSIKGAGTASIAVLAVAAPAAAGSSIGADADGDGGADRRVRCAAGVAVHRSDRCGSSTG